MPPVQASEPGSSTSGLRPQPPNVGNVERGFVGVTISSDKFCRRLLPSASGLKTSPFFAMMCLGTFQHSPWFRKNGDEVHATRRPVFGSSLGSRIWISSVRTRHESRRTS